MRTIGIYYAFWTRDWDVDFFPFIEKVKSLGFDQLEINGGTFAEMSVAARQRLVDEAKRCGIVLSYGIGLTANHDVSSLDESIRLSGVRFMRRMIEAVGKAGGGMIGGTVHSAWPSTLPKGATDKRPYLEQSKKSMRELAKVAEDNRVVLNVEVINRFEQYLLNTCEEALAYVEDIQSPACRILLDTFHMNIASAELSKWQGNISLPFISERQTGNLPGSAVCHGKKFAKRSIRFISMGRL